MTAPIPISKGKRWRLRMQCATEHTEQVSLIRWARLQTGQHPELGLLFAIPNGGARNLVTGRRLKDEGVRAGVPDLCLPVARKGLHGLYIELKRVDGGTLSAAQRQWIASLESQGYAVVVARGWQHAARALAAYLTDADALSS